MAALPTPSRCRRAVSISFAGLVAEPVAEDVVLKKPPTSSSSSATAGGASAGLQQQPQKPHFGAGSAAAGSVAASSSTTVDSGGGSSAAGEAAWFPIDDLPKLAFDAYDIIGAMRREIPPSCHGAAETEGREARRGQHYVMQLLLTHVIFALLLRLRRRQSGV